MRSKLLVLICTFILSEISFAQKNSLADEPLAFTGALIYPAPGEEPGVEEFNNFLAKEINAGTLEDKEDATYRFIVSEKGNVFEITKIKGSLGFEDQLMKALQKSSGQWNCGMQNSHKINAYVIINVSLRHKKIHAVIGEQ